ncbi:CD209 antigen-like protein D [Syngnathoides biaculeatus]|uniref:CD209 antigen-like protein D n=1 Tax=Syngnathoides biaculeatus TaxID=300417 RepID=UPI002ADDADEB|nr:CD209 antigen-like protein D [Syngnathoides biaculeatus]XP_061675633.1 CD209 antigen-like protein D [Syngnathoides biaculeatus]
MFNKLMDDEEELQPSPDVHTPNLAPSTRPTRKATGPYRTATICLATLCAVLLVAIVAVTAHHKNKGTGGGAAKPDMQTGDVDAQNAVISQLRQEKGELQKKLDAMITAAGHRATASPDMCPPDWAFFNSSCYFMSRVSRSWSEAKETCESKQAHLAIILTPEEQTFVWELLPRGHWNAYWIGVTDGHTEDRWVWVDGTELVGGFWEEGEPNNHIDEDCGYIVKTVVLERVAVRSWYDAPCDMYRPFICEKELGAAR